MNLMGPRDCEAESLGTPASVGLPSVSPDTCVETNTGPKRDSAMTQVCGVKNLYVPGSFGSVDYTLMYLGMDQNSMWQECRPFSHKKQKKKRKRQ